MKTALQKAMDWLQISKADRHTQEIFSEFLEMEKEQIIDAVAYGFKDAHKVEQDLSFEKYYNETFK